MENIILKKKLVREIRDCIKEEFDGNQTAFGRAIGASGPAVSRIVNGQQTMVRSKTYLNIEHVLGPWREKQTKQKAETPELHHMKLSETPEHHQVTLAEMQRDNTQDAILKELKAIHELIEELAKGRA